MSAPTVAEILAWPVIVPWYPHAASALGYGQHAAYAAAKDGTAPVPVLRRGRRLVVTRASILAALGIAESPAVASAAEVRERQPAASTRVG